ncbi:MAG: transposase [Caldilineaceae bacterium]
MSATSGSGEGHQEIELPEKLVEIIEHQAIETVRPCCAQSNVGEVPAHLRGPVQYGKRFKAFCTYPLVYQLLPYERTGELLATMTGYQPAGGTLKAVLEQAYDALEPVEAHIRKQLLAATVAHGDETGI